MVGKGAAERRYSLGTWLWGSDMLTPWCVLVVFVQEHRKSSKLRTAIFGKIRGNSTLVFLDFLVAKTGHFTYF